jgi:hypothetical protein
MMKTVGLAFLGAVLLLPMGQAMYQTSVGIAACSPQYDGHQACVDLVCTGFVGGDNGPVSAGPGDAPGVYLKGEENDDGSWNYNGIGVSLEGNCGASVE